MRNRINQDDDYSNEDEIQISEDQDAENFSEGDFSDDNFCTSEEEAL